MQMEARMRREPAPDLGRLVGGVVVEDQVQVEIGRCLLVDAFQKAQEFAMPMAGQAVADDHPGEHVERGEPGGGAVTFVVVGHGAGPTLLHRQSRLGAVERLDLALLIDRQHQRLVRRVEVEADDVLHLVDEVRIPRQLEGLDQVRLQPVRLPDLVHRRRRDPQLRRHCALAPVGGGRRRLVQRQLHHPLDRLHRQRLTPGRARGVLQKSVDPRPPHHLLRRVAVSHQSLQPFPIPRSQLDAFDLAHDRRAASLAPLGNPPMKAKH